MKWIARLAVLCAAGCLATWARADTIYLDGAVTQDLNDSGETAVNNPSLNNILDGDLFTITLTFNGAATVPGSINLVSVLFEDNSQPASEGGFISGTMVIAADSGNDDFEVLGCLLDPVSCTQGNELDLNFQIPAAGLNEFGVTPQIIPGLTPPVDLLEDYGSTEIQGSVTSYSYVPDAAAPEPASLVLLGSALLALMTTSLWRKL